MKCIGTIEKALYRHEQCDKEATKGAWCEYHAEIAEEFYDLSFPTLGETFFYHNDTERLVDVGRVRGSDGLHALLKPDGTIIKVGGYHLRRQGERWEDTLAKEREA